MKKLLTLTAVIALAIQSGCSDKPGQDTGPDRITIQPANSASGQQQSIDFESAYNRAVNDPSYRQEFVSNLVNIVKFPSNVPRAVYTPTILNGEEQLAMRLDTKTTFHGDRFDKVNSTLEIYPHAFDNVNGYILNAEDFMFCLKEHEFKHAEVYGNAGEPILSMCVTSDERLDMNLFHTLSELLAYENEVLKTVDTTNTGIRFRGNVSRKYATHALNGSVSHYTELSSSTNFIVSEDVLAKAKEKYHLPHFDFAKPK